MKLKLAVIIIPTVFMACTSIASAATSGTKGESSTVSFTGEIVPNTCSLSLDSKDQTVPLGKVTTNAFSGAGATAAEQPFKISLTGCDTTATGVTGVGIAFQGTTDASDNKALAVSAPETGVGIEILDGANGNKPLALDGTTVSASVPVETGVDSILNFSARYKALTDTVAAGEANATVNFTVTYE